MKGFSVLPVVVGVIVAVATVVALVVAVAIYVASVISLKVFGSGGIEVIGAFNTPYTVANTLAHYEIDGRPILESLLVGSVTGLGEKTRISNEINSLLGAYGFAYTVELEGIASKSACVKPYETYHKAVDIAANCGTPIKAICSGWLSVLGRGLTGDPVFGGASQGGQDGLQLEHEDCYISEFRGYRSFYGCVEIPDKARRRVEIGETIGYVGVCEAEKQQGCHLHFGITKSSLDKSEDPNICERLGNILDETKSVLASKGELDNPASASIPLLFKDRAGNLVVSIGQG